MRLAASRRAAPPDPVAPSPIGLLVGGCTVGLAISWNIANTGPVAGLLARHYGVGLSTIGLLTSILFLAELVVMIPGGRAIDRSGARTIGLIALAVTFAGNLLLLVVGGMPAALVLRAATGAGVGLGFLAGAVYVHADPGRPTPLVGGIYGGVSLSGGGLALAVVPGLVGPLGWRAPYATGAVVAALGLVVVAACPRTRARGSGPRLSLRTLAGDRTIARLGAVHSASFGLSVIVGNWVVTLLERTAGFGKTAAGAVGSLTLLLGVVGRPAGGAFARARPRDAWRAVAAASVLGAGAMLVLLLGPSKPLDVLAAAAIGLCAGLPFGAVFAGAARAYPQAPGAAIGAMNTYPIVAIIVGVPLVGVSFDPPGDGRIGFAVVAALWLASIAAIPRHARVADA